MIRQILIALIIGTILLQGCNNDSIVESKPKAITGQATKETSKPIVGTATKTTQKETPKTKFKVDENHIKIGVKEYYDSEELIESLKRILNASYYNFTRDISKPDYIRSSNLKYYVIHTTDNKHITTAQDFCKSYCAYNWDGYKFYLNTTIFNSYIEPLERGNFSTEEEYKNYILDRVLANYTIKEKTHNVKNGKVLEYKFWFLEQDESGNFESNLMPYLLIYKIYCSPNMTVFIRPKWERFTLYGVIGKIPEVITNWELEDDRVRGELLNKSSEIIEACGVKKDFFDDYDFEDYSKSELRAYYWKTFYKHQFNLTSTMNIDVQKKSPNSEKYVLKEVNVSFTNYEDYPLEYFKIKIIVWHDDESEKTYYRSENTIGMLEPGKNIVRNFRNKEIEFLHNITVLSTLYIDEQEAEVRPLQLTYNKKDLGLE